VSDSHQIGPRLWSKTQPQRARSFLRQPPNPDHGSRGHRAAAGAPHTAAVLADSFNRTRRAVFA
jgi:hypothetical protein